MSVVVAARKFKRAYEKLRTLGAGGLVENLGGLGDREPWRSWR
jgi:hypothetical protein